MMKKALVSLLLGATMAAAHAAWPEKPVTMIVPFPPGGSTDNIARILSAKFQQTFGGSFVVDNRPGAAGMIGAAAARRAPADGYTLFVSSLGPFVIGPHLTKNAGYDPTKDFDYISVAVQAPNVLAVPAASPHKSLQDVIAFEFNGIPGLLGMRFRMDGEAGGARPIAATATVAVRRELPTVGVCDVVGFTDSAQLEPLAMSLEAMQRLLCSEYFADLLRPS